MTDILLDSATDCAAAARPNRQTADFKSSTLLSCPRHVDIRAAEVAIRGGLCVDGAQQLQVADDGVSRAN
jgi:hypothetical protein